MRIDKVVGADKDGPIELTREEARRKREHFLNISEENTNADEGNCEEIDSADSTMATLILPGG